MLAGQRSFRAYKDNSRKVSNEMKIAFIGTRGVPANYGGTETYVDRLTKYLAAEGDEVIVYCKTSSSPEEKKRLDALYPENVKRVEIWSIPSKHLDNITRSFISTLHVCLDRSVDVVQFNNVGPALFSFMPRIFGKKVVGAIRAIDSQRGKWNFAAKAFLRFCDFLTVKVPHTTTVNSLAMKKYYLEKYNEETIYIPNGFEINEDPSKNANLEAFGLKPKGYILFAARLEPEKGCHTLIEAYKKTVERTGTDLKLAIAGHTGFTSDYYSAIEREQSDSIKLLGYVEPDKGLNLLFSQAYAFVLPSSVEGMSNSLLSAMAYAIPSVVSDIPENLALFDDTETNAQLNDYPGLSFHLEDSESLSEKLECLVNDAGEAELRGQLLREHVNTYFSLSIMCKSTKEVYLDLLS